MPRNPETKTLNNTVPQSQETLKQKPLIILFPKAKKPQSSCSQTQETLQNAVPKT
jgi:hypothetical protein